MFNQTTEYALRIIAHLAAHYGEAGVTTRDIAAVTKVPESYLSKVLQELARAGLIKSQRGPNGGSVLARDPADVNLYDVVQAVSPIRRITTCPLGLKSHGVNLCPLHKRLDNALALVEDAFRSSTLADLLAEPTTSTPLCESFTPTAVATRPATLTVTRKKK